MRQIYCRGLVLKTIYQTGSVLKQIVREVSSLRGCRHYYWHEACNATGNDGINGCRHWQQWDGVWLSLNRHSYWRDRLSRREEHVTPMGLAGHAEAMPPLVLAGHAYVDSPAIGTCGSPLHVTFLLQMTVWT